MDWTAIGPKLSFPLRGADSGTGKATSGQIGAGSPDTSLARSPSRVERNELEKHSMEKIGLVSFMHESNSFNPEKTDYEMFSPLTGDQVVATWIHAHHEVGGILEEIPKQGLEVVPLITAWAMPAGPVQESTYERILQEMSDLISAESLDGLMLSLHGAMVAEHVRDADGETAARVRQLVGPSLPVVLTLDLHANVSQRLIDNVAAATIYRTYPHLDQRQRGREASRIMAGILGGQIRPVQALETPPMIINILAQKSSAEPMRGLYRRMEEILEIPGIVSASIAPGFAYADAEQMGVAFLVVANEDEQLARREARALARQAWDLRERFNLFGESVEEAVRRAGQSSDTPVTLLDVGDNVGGGTPGDSTILFDAVLQAGLDNALVVLHDPESVEACRQAGVGRTISLQVGGKSVEMHGRPVPITGTVRTLNDGFFIEREVRHGGKYRNNQGLTALVETPEGHSVILTSERMAPMSLEQVRSVGVRPEWKRILIAKGAIAPRAAYEPVSKQIIEVDTPGVSAADPRRFDYQHRRRPMYPFESDATWQE